MKFDTIAMHQKSPSFVGAAFAPSRDCVGGGAHYVEAMNVEAMSGKRTNRLGRGGLAAAAAVACAVLFATLLPRARESAAVLLAQDDPAALSDAQTQTVLRADPGNIDREVRQALDDKDSDLARSFQDVAFANNVRLDPDLSARVDDAVATDASATNKTKRFVTGFLTGDASDLASFSGTVAGDLFVYGDIRDVVRESKHLVTGEAADHLVLGLAATGLAITAATYVSAGGALPARAGLTLVKDARKVGRLGAGFTEWAGRAGREVVDSNALRQAVAGGSIARPGQTISAVKAAFKAEKAASLVRVAKDVGRVGEKAGTKGALDSLRIAQGPKDLSRAATLAEAKGGQTRALLKMFGRGALLLTAGAFQMAMWLFWAIVALFGFVCSIKAAAENLTLAWLRRRKAKRVRHQLAQLTARPPLATVAAAG